MSLSISQFLELKKLGVLVLPAATKAVHFNICVENYMLRGGVDIHPKSSSVG